MSTATQAALLFVSNASVLVAVVGLVVRRRLSLGYFFALYLVAVLILSSMVVSWPERFHTWNFYWIKESVYSLLKVGIALELTVTVFQAFPLARRVARGALVLVLMVTLIAAWSAVPDPMPTQHSERQWADFVLALHPRITNGTAWLFGALFGVILYYRLPLHALHKAIAFGFMAYLLFLTYSLDLLRRSDFARRGFIDYGNAVGYALVAGYWAWSAWRRDPVPPVDPAVVHRLQPWREGASPDL